MADGDQRIEVLEDEMKVLKGEVSRTLVDLRALLMREDSPLMTGSLLQRVAASGDSGAGATSQMNLAPVSEPPASPAVGAPGVGDGSSAAVPVEVVSMPSQGDVSPAAVPVEVVSMPSPPTAGDFDPSADEERARQRRARLQEEEVQEEAQRAQRARRREQERLEEEADRERRERKKSQEREEETADQERRNRRKQQESEEDEEQEHRNRRRQQERAEGENDQQRQDRDREQQREEDEERDRREHRNRQDREEDEQRDRKRRQDREEDEERDRRRKQDREEDEERDRKRKQDRAEDEDLEPRRQQDRAEDEDLEPRRQQDRAEEEDLEPRRRPDRAEEEADLESRGHRKSQEREEEEAGQEPSEPRNQREREEDEEMERLSESQMSPDDLDADPDAGPGMGLSEQDAEFDRGPMSVGAGGADFDDGEDTGYDSDYPGDDYLPSAGRDQDADYDPDYDRDGGREDEIGDEFTPGHADGYSDELEDDWDYPPAPSPKDEFDSSEHEEEPKINENNGSRRPRRPDAARRAYEDRYNDDRNQEYGRGPQNPPRSQRMPRPPANRRGGPRGNRPAPGNYGYPPNVGNSQWGQQPPAGYEQWRDPQGWMPDQSPMDLNLVSSLLRWASLAKYRVGEKRLSDIIDLYVESRSAPPGLKEALTHIASIVDDQPPESGQTAQETLDLIAHLHGILTAALPVPEVPQIHSKINFSAGDGAPDGNGDW